MYNSNEDALKETARAATDGNVCSGMDENAFETLLKTSVDEFPPDDIVKEVSPWRNAMRRVLIGLALCSVKLNVWCLQYILPTCGMVLSFLGFRTLRQENKWFRYCFVISIIRMVCTLQFLILNSTIILNTFFSSRSSIVITAVRLSLLFAELFCFWRGIQEVQQKAEFPPKANSALALIIWYIILSVLALFSYNQAIIVIIAMIVSFFFILRNIYKLSLELDEAGYSIRTAPSRVAEWCIVSLLLFLLLTGCTLGYLFGNSYPMNFQEVNQTEQSEVAAVKSRLLELGFPEYVLNDLAPEDIAACDGALLVVYHSTDHPVNDGRTIITTESELDGKKVISHSTVYDRKELRITGVAVQMSEERDRWILFQHFLWTVNPGFYGTESIQLIPTYQRFPSSWASDGEIGGRILYDQGGKTFFSPYYSLGNHAYVSNEIFSKGQTRMDVFATFSMPNQGENHRGYVTYAIKGARDGCIVDSWLNYTHQRTWLQYPVMTAMEKRMTNPWNYAGAFFTVQDALQFFPSKEGVELLYGPGNVS